MDISSIFIVVFIIAILLIGIGLFIYLIISNKMEFTLRMRKKDEEKDIAVKHTAFESQEAERKRIGEDLHDDIGPQLALLKMHFSMLKMKHPDLDAETLNPITNQLNATIDHVRQVSHDLVPAVLYELGLTTALHNISNQLNLMPGLESNAVLQTIPEIDKKKALAIYRIVQESVNNAIKHASSSKIDIALRCEENSIITEISDNGKGLAQHKSIANGLGLKNMQERALTFNGQLDIESSNGQGTTIKLTLPITSQS